MEENDLDPITCYENLVLRLQDKSLRLNGVVSVATLDCTNNDISVFLSNWDRPIAEIAIWLDFKFHHTGHRQMLHRERAFGKSMILAI